MQRRATPQVTEQLKAFPAHAGVTRNTSNRLKKSTFFPTCVGVPHWRGHRSSAIAHSRAVTTPASRRMTPAELRVRLHRLGLSTYDLAEISTWDQSGLARQASGRTGVSARTARRIAELEAEAEAAVKEASGRIVRGEAITVPRPRGPHAAEPHSPGEYPPTWHHAIVARALDRVTDSEPAVIEYDT